MDNNKNDSMSFKYSLQVIKKRKWLILCCVIGVIVPIIIYNHLTAPIYEATTMIIYEDHNRSSAISYAFQASFGKSLINDQVKEVKSYSLAQDVYAALPPAIRDTYPLPKKRQPNFRVDDYIIKQIQKRIATNTSVKSNIVEIKVEAFSPEAAEIVANTIADVIKQRDIEVKKQETSNVLKLIEKQIDVFKGQVEQSEKSLRVFKESGRITYLEKESEEIFRRITEAETIYNHTAALYNATQKRFEAIQDKLASERRDLIPSITKITSPWAQKLKEKLIELEVQYTELKVKNYSDDHPKMRIIKDQIEQTKESLMAETSKIEKGENTVNPLTQIQKFEMELISLDIERVTYNAQKTTLEKIIKEYNDYLIEVPAKEMRLAQLKRDMEVNNQIYTALLQRREEAKIADAEKMGNIRIIDPAIAPEKPVSPRSTLNLIIGSLVGLILGIGLALYFEQIDDSVKTVTDLEKNTDLTVLGSIPGINFQLIVKNGLYKEAKENAKRGIRDERYKLIINHKMKSHFVESFRALRTYIQFIKTSISIRTIMITSPSPKEGKSLIAANLAISMAQMGMKTLLIDADLRRPVQNALFAKHKIPGLTDYLLTFKEPLIPNQSDESTENNYPFSDSNPEFSTSRELEFNDVNPPPSQSVDPELSSDFYEIINHTDIENLSLLTCGKMPPDPSAIFTSKQLKNFMQRLKANYEMVIIDASPVLPVADPIMLAPIVDGVILVVKAEQSSKQEVVRATNLIKIRGKLIGAVLNNTNLESPSYYYYNER